MMTFEQIAARIREERRKHERLGENEEWIEVAARKIRAEMVERVEPQMTPMNGGQKLYYYTYWTTEDNPYRQAVWTPRHAVTTNHPFTLLGFAHGEHKAEHWRLDSWKEIGEAEFNMHKYQN